VPFINGAVERQPEESQVTGVKQLSFPATQPFIIIHHSALGSPPTSLDDLAGTLTARTTETPVTNVLATVVYYAEFGA
jgi:hypothetical protein